ncbi:unnamed protein product [Calicophoron daubneyi]|uniref:CRAL-TRIO domain-containing protein n=1 Tax=Calicophoron daubneyi TaxID=300641 RepID=A0AAV2TWP4_CALDB
MQTDKLPESVKQKAKEELHENAEHNEAHIESFRRWIESLPHISYPCEPRLLLPFLRYAKFIHSKAQARFDNFCTVRGSFQQGEPSWFHYPPLNDPLLDEYLKSGIMFELGRTEDNVTMFMIRVAGWDPNKLDRPTLRRFIFMDLDRLTLDPIGQIAGCGFFCDMAGVTARHVLLRTSAEEMRTETRAWQEAYPLRLKHLIYYNEPIVMDTLMDLVENVTSDKIRDRILHIRGKLDKAFDKIPGLKAIIPFEYGGMNECVESLIKYNEKKFHEFYSNPPPWRTISVDELKRPDTARNYMKACADVDLKAFGTEGTYVQLDPGD